MFLRLLLLFLLSNQHMMIWMQTPDGVEEAQPYDDGDVPHFDDALNDAQQDEEVHEQGEQPTSPVDDV